jgi:hypothetical protein
MRRVPCLVAAVLLLVTSGCGGKPPGFMKTYPGEKRDVSQVARLKNAADAYIAMIDDHDVPHTDDPFGGEPALGFDVLPGNHRITVMYFKRMDDRIRYARNYFTLRFDAEAGKTYSLAVVQYENGWFPLLADTSTRAIVARPER